MFADIIYNNIIKAFVPLQISWNDLELKPLGQYQPVSYYQMCIEVWLSVASDSHTVIIMVSLPAQWHRKPFCGEG